MNVDTKLTEWYAAAGKFIPRNLGNSNSLGIFPCVWGYTHFSVPCYVDLFYVMLCARKVKNQGVYPGPKYYNIQVGHIL